MQPGARHCAAPPPAPASAIILGEITSSLRAGSASGTLQQPAWCRRRHARDGMVCGPCAGIPGPAKLDGRGSRLIRVMGDNLARPPASQPISHQHPEKRDGKVQTSLPVVQSHTLISHARLMPISRSPSYAQTLVGAWCAAWCATLSPVLPPPCLSPASENRLVACDAALSTPYAPADINPPYNKCQCGAGPRRVGVGPSAVLFHNIISALRHVLTTTAQHSGEDALVRHGSWQCCRLAQISAASCHPTQSEPHCSRFGTHGRLQTPLAATAPVLRVSR